MKKTLKSVLRSFVVCLLAVLMAVPVFAVSADDMTTVVKGLGPVEVATERELKEALKRGGFIELTSDITTTESGALNTSVNAIIELNGKTLTIGAGAGYNRFIERDITIQNGTIRIDGVVTSEYVFGLVGSDVTLKDVNVEGKNYGANNGVFFIDNNSTLKVNGGKWTLKNDQNLNGGVFKADYAGATLEISNTTMDLHNVCRVVTNATTTITGSTITITGDADGVDDEMKHGFNSAPLTIENSNITMENLSGRGITADDAAVEIKNSIVTITNCNDATIKVDGKVVTVSEGSTVTVDKAPTLTKGGTIVGTVIDTSALPNAEVNELGSMTLAAGEYQIFDGNLSNLVTSTDPLTLQIAMQFLAKDTPAQAEANAYGEYNTDFYITIEGAEGNGFDGEGCYLVGNYGDWNWIAIPLSGSTIANGTYPVLNFVGATMNYIEVCTSVQDFKCGIYLTPEVLKNNPKMTVTLELGLTDPTVTDAEIITVGETYTYTVADFLGDALPNAEVNALGTITVEKYTVWDGKTWDNDPENADDITLQIAMQFLANDTKQDALNNAFGQYITDFYITVNGLKDGLYEADGCYLAGNYGTYGWVMVPLDDMTIENGKVYPVITSVGAKFTYVDICDSVKDFQCGIYFTDEFLNANPDMTVTLELGLSETLEKAQNGQFIRVGEAYTYTAEELLGNYAKFAGAKVVIGTDLTVQYGVVLGSNVNPENVSVKFTREDNTQVSVTNYKQKDNYYIFEFTGVTPQCIGDNIKAELYIGNAENPIDTIDNYSVKTYLLNIKADHAENTALATLVDNTLAYGAAAQTYRNYKTDELITNGLILDNTTATPDENCAAKLVGAGTEDTHFLSATVWFSNVNKLAFKYEGTADVAVSVTKDNDIKNDITQECTIENGVITTPAIAALGMDGVYTVELFVDGETDPVQTLTYSVASYVYSTKNSTTTSETMKDLAIALYNYGTAAKAYQASLTTNG